MGRHAPGVWMLDLHLTDVTVMGGTRVQVISTGSNGQYCISSLSTGTGQRGRSNMGRPSPKGLGCSQRSVAWAGTLEPDGDMLERLTRSSPTRPTDTRGATVEDGLELGRVVLWSSLEWWMHKVVQ
ncbi:hypothetical protein TIFTF001_014566 [Ficus carica]|uniref:Uncharacterized protein n=1 Tax=Ficus carica TaxID=3494 RepID=A0AA88A3Z6_FICCA|nr:hypothetical protein TIFTF001_014566 [Ficus carica]